MASRSSPAPAALPVRPSLWRRPLAAVRANLLPGLFLQAFALAVVLAYYFHAPTRQALDAVAAYKQRTGYAYSFFATACFGGLIPFLWMRLNPATRRFTPLSHGVFLFFFWAVKGMEVDAFYRFQSRVWGDDLDVFTVAAKVIADLYVYCPLWATPTTLLVFYWKEHGFDFSALRRLDKAAFLRENLLTALVTTWSVWLPAICLIYSLPPPLQIPLFNIVLCLFSLILAALTRKAGEASPT